MEQLKAKLIKKILIFNKKLTLDYLHSQDIESLLGLVHPCYRLEIELEYGKLKRKEEK